MTKRRNKKKDFENKYLVYVPGIGKKNSSILANYLYQHLHTECNTIKVGINTVFGNPRHLNL